MVMKSFVKLAPRGSIQSVIILFKICVTSGAWFIKLFTAVIYYITQKASVFVKANEKLFTSAKTPLKT